MSTEIFQIQETFLFEDEKEYPVFLYAGTLVNVLVRGNTTFVYPLQSKEIPGILAAEYQVPYKIPREHKDKIIPLGKKAS